MGDRSVGSSVSTLGLATTPFKPMSPLPSMDTIMQSPGLVHSPGQEGKALDKTNAPPVQKALPRDTTLKKLEQAEGLIGAVRKGAVDLIEGLRETAKASSASADDLKGTSGRKRHLASIEKEVDAKHAKVAGALGKGFPEQGQVSTAEAAEVTPVSLVIDRVEAALAELAGLGKELTEAGVSFSPNDLDEARVEPDGEFAAREWGAYLAQKKAAEDEEKMQSMFKRICLKLRARHEEDREMVWELDKVARKSGCNPEEVAGILRLLRENGLLEEKEEAPSGSLVQQLERVLSLVMEMEFELVGESGMVLWQSASRESKRDPPKAREGREKQAEDPPAKLRCLLPGVLRAALGVSRDGQPTTVAICGATQATEQPDSTGHHVFQAVTNIATSALVHYKIQRPRSALERFLVWLFSYRSLFTQSCSVCGRILAQDPRSGMLLPPVIRSYKAILPHDAQDREASHSFCHVQRLAQI